MENISWAEASVIIVAILAVAYIIKCFLEY